MLAYNEFQRIRNLSAFNVDSIAKRRNINAHCRRYDFPDGSILRLYKSGKGTVARPNDGAIVCIGDIAANAFGN